MPKNTKSSKKVEKVVDLKADVYNIKGEKTGKITLPENIFSLKSNPALVAQAVRVYLENQRQGTRKVQTRGQTTGSTRKIYRQKGTGRARHGDIKAPIFVGGGVAHGPKVTDFKAKLSQKMRKKALFTVLSDKLHEEKIRVINTFAKFPPKTKNMIEFLDNLKLLNKSKDIVSSVLLVTDSVNNQLFLASRNIPKITVTPANQINTYEVLKHQNLILAKDSVAIISGELKESKPKASEIKVKSKEKSTKAKGKK